MRKTPAQYMKELRRKRNRHRLCTRCGHKIEKPGYKTCKNCRDYAKEYNKNHKPPKKEKVIIRKLKTWEVTDKKLYDALINKKINIAELAELIGVTPRSVQRWIFENKDPTEDHKALVNKVLKKEIYNLY